MLRLELDGWGGADLCATASRLRHSWLENLLLTRHPGDIVRLYESKGPARCAFEADIRPGGLFDLELAATRDLAARVVAGFSPGHLTDMIRPLGLINPGTRERVRAKVHAIYLATSGVAELAIDLEAASASVGDSLAALRGAWFARKANVFQTYAALQKHSSYLHDVLARVPRGFVLT